MKFKFFIKNTTVLGPNNRSTFTKRPRSGAKANKTSAAQSSVQTKWIHRGVGLSRSLQRSYLRTTCCKKKPSSPSIAPPAAEVQNEPPRYAIRPIVPDSRVGIIKACLSALAAAQAFFFPAFNYFGLILQEF